MIEAETIKKSDEAGSKRWENLETRFSQKDKEVRSIMHTKDRSVHWHPEKLASCTGPACRSECTGIAA